MTHRLVLFDDHGNQISERKFRWSGEDLGAEEYGIAIKAKEMYRDAMYALGKWTKENRMKGTRSDFWGFPS